MKMSKGFMLFMACLGLVGVTGAVVASSSIGDNIVFAQTRNAPNYSSCASIHFGMTDSADYSYGTAKTYEITSNKDTVFNNGKSAVVSGVNITSVEVTNTYMGSTTKAYPFKCGKTKEGSSLIINFENSIVGCTLYLLSYAEDVTVTINDNYSILIDNKFTGSLPTKQSTASDYTYLPYRFTFESTNQLKLTTEKGRYLIGDIALRIA